MTVDPLLLTGLPRSGTTLVCHLLNKLPDTIALVEPMDVGRFARLPTRAAIADDIAQFAETQRATLRSEGLALTRHVGGAVSDNLFAPDRTTDGLRSFHASHGSVHFDKPLSAGLTLVIKHPAAFTVLLPDLAERFPVYAVVRNPLAALASWNSTRIPVNDGHAPAAEQHDGDLARALSGIDDRIGRQLHLLNWYFGQYRAYLPPGRILRYEDIVASGGAALGAILPAAGALREPLENRNRSAIYDKDQVAVLAARLLGSDGHYLRFYTAADICGLLD